MILYNRPADPGSPNVEASMDVLDQVEMARSALAEAGIETECAEVRGNMEAEHAFLCRTSFDVVFNLVESVNENPLLFPNVAAMLELIGVPFTGSSSTALAVSTNKSLAKMAFRGAGLPTPDWRIFDGKPDFSMGNIPPPWIVKPVHEDGSIGIDESSLYEDERLLLAALPKLRTTHGSRPLLVEKYIDGREFNVSLLEGEAGLETLPLAEIDFSAFPPAKPRIVGYRAKWNSTTFEYQNTPRIFISENYDLPLARALKELSISACHVLGISGYARVDFRVSRDGRPWILEVNANPCIAPDSGFIAAAATAGLSSSQTIMRIIEAAKRKVPC